MQSTKETFDWNRPKKILKEYGPSEEKLQGEQLVGIKAGSEHELHKANRQMTPVDSLCGTAETNSQKNKLSSEVPTEEQRVMKEADSHSSSHPGISRLFVNPFGPKGRLKLLNEPRVHTRGKDGTRSPETSSKKTDSCEKNRAHLYKNKQRRFLLTPRPVNDNYQATKNKVQANVRKPAMVARQLSLPNQGLSPSEETASSSGLPSIPRQRSFPTKLQRSHSSSGPSTSTHTPTKGPASTMQSNVTGNTKEQVNSHRPIRRDRNNSLEMQDDFRRGPGHHHRASGDRAPRRRPNSHKPATTLMKRATNDAKELTRATNRFPPKKTRYSVGEGYKWSEPKPTKGSSREEKGRAPPRHYL
ncbi:uncharacterized protein LOC129112422 [Anoplopoma fimbria]|uniref:uncharacterized protein LOC129112422 n=1 Tax=Anoplopoma fimbria TaxID=229290 RepID=UPI0023ED9EDC|nr:uncharacterized protein LOC129112422 [Anoplopoma fimbria]